MTASATFDTGERRVLLPPVMPDGLEIPDGTRHRLEGAIFATGWRVDVVREGDPAGEALWLARLRARILAALEAIDAQMSPWRADSELMRFNRAGAGKTLALPQPMRAVVEGAIAVADLTGGAFDPTLHEAVTLWGFSAEAVAEGLPDPERLDALRDGRRDWRSLVLDDDGLATGDGLAIDLCGIAKGYAVDAVLAVVRADPEARAALVEVGGELKGWGIRPDGMPWWVEIERPEGAADMPFVAALCDWAVASSGDYIRSFRHEGADYCHAIDPRSLAPVRTGIASVTVFDRACWRADALATALMVMGLDHGLAFAEAHGIPCILTVRTRSTLSTHLSVAMRDWLDDDD